MPAPEFQVLRNGLVLDVAARRTEPADILIEGDTIRDVAAPGCPAPPDAVTVDASGRLVMPGLVNAHTHGHGSLGKGLGDRWSLELLLNASPWVSGGFTPEDKRTAALLNAAEMILKGCTAAYDMFVEMPAPSAEGLAAVGEAYREVGVRVVLAPMMADRTLFQAIPGLLDALPPPHREHARRMQAATHEEHLAACARLLAHWPFDHDQVRPALGPTIPLHCSDAFITGCRDLAADTGARVQMHLAESKVQAVAGLERYGRTLTAHRDRLGLLGPRFTGAHCVWLDDDDLARMADRGATIAHNPGSNLRLGSGIAPAARMRGAGVTFGIGSDGSASSDNQNMFEAMRTAALVSRVAAPDPGDWLGTWDVIEAATAGGAAVLGMDGAIGHLAPGFKADLVLLDLANVNFVPLNDAANQVVNCEDSSAVHSVMVGGRMVLESRRFTSFDYEGLRRTAADTVERLREATADARAGSEALAPLLSAFCVGLVCRPYHVHRRVDHGGGGA